MTSSDLHPSAKPLSVLLSGFNASSGFKEVDILGITNNSHQVVPGALFIALQGETAHGIDYAVDALSSGAIVVLYCTQDKYSEQQVQQLSQKVQAQCQVQWIGIDNLDSATGEIASRFYGEPSKAFKLIGVTGTDGKTSVTHLLMQALSRMKKLSASIGTIGYGVANQRQSSTHTTPDAIILQSYLHEFRQQQCEYVVMEVSSHALAQYRVNGCHFDIAVLTHLSRDHIDYHGTQQAYADAKAKLFSDFQLSAKVLNSDDAFGRSLCQQSEASALVRFSAQSDSGNVNSGNTDSGNAEVRLIKSDITDRGLRLRVASPLGDIIADTALMGRLNIENILACISTLIALRFEHKQIQHAVTDLQPIPGRMEQFKGASEQPIVVVDFAHTEKALRTCLGACREYTDGNIYCIFGCGGDRDKGKRKGMGQIAEQLADKLIVTDDNPRTESPDQIVADILMGIAKPEKVSVIHSRLAAIESALSDASANDLVLIAGKGCEQDQIIGHTRHPFSDRDLVQRILGISA